MIKIFISYCRENTDEKNELIKHLRPLTDREAVEIWHDREISSGSDWQKAIDEHLSDANIVLCLLSSEFIDSDACKQEVNKANDLGKRILPIILGPCAWKDLTFADGTLMGKKRAMPSNEHHLLEISKWRDKNEAWLVVYEEIKKICIENVSIQNRKLRSEFILTLNDCGPIKGWHPNKENLILDDIYVWPEFTKSGTEDKAAVKEAALLEDIEKSKGIWIVGEDLSGKTSLAKQIFIKLQRKGFIPVFFPSSHSYEGKVENQIKKKISEQYENIKPADFDNYKDVIVLIIDDFHKIASDKEKVLRRIKELSFKHVFTTDKVFSLIFWDDSIKYIKSYSTYEIAEFYPIKRCELIKKWLTLGKSDYKENEFYKILDEQTRNIDSTMGKTVGHGILPSYPFFILSIINPQMEKILDTEVTSQGHFYHTLICLQFQRNKLTKDLDKYLNLVCSLAYFFYKGKIKSIAQKDLEHFIDHIYKEKYNFPKSTNELINQLDSIGILTKDNLENYEFYYEYFYYFFVAKYITDNLDDCSEDIEVIFDNLHKNENAYISIFISHHSKDKKVLDSIWLNSNILFEKCQPATLLKNENNFIDNQMKVITNVATLSSSDDAHKLNREKELKDLDEKEKRLSEQKDDDFDDEDTDRKLTLEFRKCMKTAEVMGHIIKNRSGSLKKDKIKDIFKDAMNIHLRALSFLFKSLEDNGPLFQKAIKESIKNKVRGSDDDADRFARQVIADIVSRNVLGTIGVIVFSLGSDDLSLLIEEVCDEIGTPASLLVKRGVLMHYRKNLPIDAIYNESKDLSSAGVPSHMGIN